jgi:hypothetical protein
MTHDDLVERAARAMHELPVRGSAITCDWAHAPDEIKEAYFDEARAAIHIALEEAVPVAARIMRDSIAAWLEGNGFAEAAPFVRALPLTQAEAPAIRAMIKDGASSASGP